MCVSERERERERVCVCVRERETVVAVVHLPPRSLFDRSGKAHQHRNVQRFLVFKAHRLCVSLNSRLESNKEEKEKHIRAVREYQRHQAVVAVVHLVGTLFSGWRAGCEVQIHRR